MQLYRFEIKSSLLEEATLLIEENGGTVLFSSEGEEGGEIYAHLPEGVSLPLKGEPAELPAIDWEGQWEQHGVSALKVGGTQIKLISGPGFGDFSHPTTQLMIEMMQEHLQADTVVDVGCGSGILSLAAVALGAKHVIGIDIDEAAIGHSRENARENGFERYCTFCLPEEFEAQPAAFILMNMITSEQKVAWKDTSAVGLITSGVLKEERADYLNWLKEWTLVDEKERDGWLAFYWVPKHV